MTHSAFNTLYKTMDTVGDGTGSKDANVNGSITPVTFKAVTPADHRYEFYRMIIEIGDVGSFAADGYGALTTLPNGMTVGLYDSDDSLMIDLFDGLPVKSHADWSRVCYDVKLLDFGAGAEDSVTIRWTFAKDIGGPLIIEEGQYLGVTVNDDLTGLLHHYYTVRGIIRHV